MEYLHKVGTEVLMKEHWLKGLKIPLSDEYNMLVLPDSTKEPAKKMKLPVVVAAGQKKRGRTGGNPIKLWWKFHPSQRVSMTCPP